jgi:hypothetical protein
MLTNSLISTLLTSTEIFIDWKVSSRKHKPDEAASPVSLLLPCLHKDYAIAKSLRRHLCEPAEYMNLP